jgi:non-homologous end joining protein Ku
MRSAYELIFRTVKGEIRVNVEIRKSTDERMSFRTGYVASEGDEPKCVKYIKVVPKNPDQEKITSKKDIDVICEQSDLVSMYPTGEDNDDGSPAHVVIDKTRLKHAFPSSPDMRVIKVVPWHAIKPHQMTDSHYFVDVRRVKKNKTRVSNPDDDMAYCLFYKGLRRNSEMAIVKYTAMNNNKYAVVYADDDGLRMVNLVGSNYQRERCAEQPIKGKFVERMYEKLVETMRSDDVDCDFEDDYQKRLEKLVKYALKGETYKAKVRMPCISAKLSALLDSDDEETVKVK